MADPLSQFDPGFRAFGGGATSSILHPVVLAAVVLVAALTFFLPRKYVIVPLLLGILLTPAGQNLYIGVHLYVYRILILIGWGRLLSSKPSSGRFLPGGVIILDKVFLIWATYRALAVILLFGQFGAITNQSAFLLDSVGGYFLFRTLIRDDQDVRRVVKVFAIVAAVSALVMLIELKTGQNILGSSLGGIRAISDVRNGRIRAQGVFAHSILAGSFGAAAFPLFLWLWKREKTRLTAAIGAVSASIMVFACASSTPVAAWLGSIGAICLWPIRKNMRMVRWVIVLALIGLQLVMKAPVWYVLAHIDLAGGSSGWNRANLIDTFIRHVRDWWLIGTHDNVNWGWDMWDQCNQFVTEGETGGLVALGCFIAMIVICFRKIGKARKAVTGHSRKEWLFWLLGAAMFAQVMAFMGVDYFDQSIFAWYALLVIIPVATMLPRVASAGEAETMPVSASASTHYAPESADVMTFDNSSGSLSQRLFG